MREGLVSLLVAAGDLVPTTACSSLDELYEAVERDEPDVVVTDIRMPPNHRDEGIQAARRFRDDAPRVGRRRALPVRRSGVCPRPARRRHPRPRLRAEGSRRRGRPSRPGDQGRRRRRLVHRRRGRRRTRPSTDADGRLATPHPDGAWSSTCWRRWRRGPRMRQSPSRSVSARTPIEKHSTAIFVKLGLDEAADVNRRVMAVLMFLAGPQPVGSG